MRELRLDLGDRSYQISIGAGLIDKHPCFQALDGCDVLVVTNETVGPIYLDRVSASIGANRLASVSLPDGESYKDLTTLNQIFDALLTHRFSRDCVLVALGGGVVGDMTGFAAATYQRGVRFLQIPTTLLAQVDSSVGGKTGVNHTLGKNMIGAFYQPMGVLIDISTLDTLPDRELAAGLAEVIKYGLICDAPFFDWIETNLDALLARDGDALGHAIYRSCEIKADIVSRDEREGGVRALLNLGHTFGHAIENALGYGTWLHGEAVAAGMCMAADMSRRLGLIDNATQERTERLIERAGLPVRLPAGLSAQTMADLMKVDKKVEAGVVRLILMHDIGRSFITGDFESETLMTALQEYPRLAS